jgi:uncharacterized membrane protein HdeD (DUF308 family)
MGISVVQDPCLAYRHDQPGSARPGRLRTITRGSLAAGFAGLALIVPAVAIAALVLLSAVYVLAGGLLALAAVIDAGSQAKSWDRVVREDVADLASGDAAELWPIVTVLAFIVVLGA